MISWTVPLVRAGQEQRAYEIEVVSDEARASAVAAQAEPIFSSGIVNGRDPWMRIPVALTPNSAARARVRVLDENGVWSDWSDPLNIETGPHRIADWPAEWISHPGLHVLRRTFTLTSPAARGRVHLTAQGLVNARVNGVEINSDSSDPSRTDISRALYRTYDVTDLLRTGANVLDLELAHGEWERTGLDPRVLACVIVDGIDGSRATAGTGSGMLAAASSVVVHEPFYLERHDLTLPAPDFTPATDLLVLDAVADPVTPNRPPARVEADPAPPIRVVQTIDARPMDANSEAPDTANLWDVGVNVAGRSRIVIRSAVQERTVVRVVHGEHVDNGHVDTTNLSMPYDMGRVRQSLEYVLPASDGSSELVLEPRFCYHGFRYIQVTGLPSDADISVQAAVLHSDLQRVSMLQTDDQRVNALTAAAGRTMLNNVHGIPEDCPTREQSGWTGDTASVSEFEFSAYDMQTFFAKWIDDLLTSQQPDGSIPAIAPDIRPEKVPADPVWGGALQRVLIGHWLHYGDKQLVQRGLPALRRWADFQLTCRSANGVIGDSPISYGHDWLALEQTPPELHHTAATLDSLSILAFFEDEFGHAELARTRRAQAAELLAAARHAFVDGGRSTVGNGSQASYAIALDGGWLTAQEAIVAADRLEADVRARENRVSSGFATTRTVVRALTRSGRSQVVFDALQQSSEPGIGAMLSSGNGTFWECWWIDPANTGTGSLDHLGLGGPFASWAWQSLAGLRPLAAGYARFAVEPHPVAGVDNLSLTTQTVRGTVGVTYRRTGDELLLELTVPVGSEAVLRLSDRDGGRTEEVVGPGHHSRTAAWPIGVDQSAVEQATGDKATGDKASAAFQPPTLAPQSVDVVGDPGLLGGAVATGTLAGGDGEELVVGDTLRCMPVPHAQLHGPIVLVRGTSLLTPPAPSAVLHFDPPLDAAAATLGGATFMYAMVDLCLDNPARPRHTVLTVSAADGTSRQATGTIWPAGWNRVSVDITDWNGASAVTSVSVAVAFDSAALPTATARQTDAEHTDVFAFRLGEVGYSTVRRTWP
jgi:alpha-L-rhamnosidase